MNDEMRFRIWNCEEKKMIFPDDTSVLGAYLVLACAARKPLVFLLGSNLHDKRGIEIYEGDIISASDGKNQITGRVVFQNCQFEIIWPNETYNKSLYIWYRNTRNNDEIFKVIGNTYENPHVVKGKNKINLNVISETAEIPKLEKTTNVGEPKFYVAKQRRQSIYSEAVADTVKSFKGKIMPTNLVKLTSD